MTTKLFIYVNFANDAGVMYVAPIDIQDGKVGGFDERDGSAGYGHNTNEDWHEASDIFGLVKDDYVAQVKNYFPLSDENLAEITKELDYEGLCSISLDDPPAVDDLNESEVNVFGEILFEAEDGEFPNPVVISL